MVKSFSPATLSEALRIRSQQDVCPIAGGTDLMVRYRSPSTILPAFTKDMLFTKNMAELNVLEKREDQLCIGANVSLAHLIDWEHTPQVLRLAMQEMASPAIRNMGTIAGNICNASPAGDTLPPLYALDAVVCLQSAGAMREMPIRDFISGPGKTALTKEELLVSIKIPTAVSTTCFYKKVAMRKATAISKVSIAMTADKTDGRLVSLAVAVGAAAPTVVRIPEAEQMVLNTNKHDAALLATVYDKYAEKINPIDDVRSTAEYRRTVAMNLLHYVYENCIK